MTIAQGSAQRGLIPTLVLLTSFGPFATDMYLSAFPEMQSSLHTDGRGVAASLSVFLFGLAAGQLVYGPVSDRVGRRGPLLAGSALFCLASLGALFSQDATSFLVLRALQALGGACGVILSRAVLRDLYSDVAIARAFSTLSMIGMGAPIVAPSVGVAIVLLAGWRAIFALLAALGLSAFLAVWFGLPETLPAQRRNLRLTPATVLRAFASLAGDRAFLLAALTTGAASGALFAFITGSSVVFLTGFGMSKPTYALLFSAAVLAMIAGGLANRRLLARLAPDRLLSRALYAQCVAGAALVCLVQLGPWGLFAGLLATMTAIGFILPNGAAAALSQAGRQSGSASSLLGVLQFGSGFAASTLVSLAQNGTAYPMALTMAGCAVASRFTWSLRMRRRVAA